MYDTSRYLPWKEFIVEKKGQHNMPLFTYTILFLCTLLLLISFALNGWTFAPLSINPSLGPSPEILIRLGAKDSMLIVNEYEIWRLFTPMFLRKCILMYKQISNVFFHYKTDESFCFEMERRWIGTLFFELLRIVLHKQGCGTKSWVTFYTNFVLYSSSEYHQCSVKAWT